jgi:hypothetical protein
MVPSETYSLLVARGGTFKEEAAVHFRQLNLAAIEAVLPVTRRLSRTELAARSSSVTSKPLLVPFERGEDLWVKGRLIKTLFGHTVKETRSPGFQFLRSSSAPGRQRAPGHGRQQEIRWSHGKEKQQRPPSISAVREAAATTT